MLVARCCSAARAKTFQQTNLANLGSCRFVLAVLTRRTRARPRHGNLGRGTRLTGEVGNGIESIGKRVHCTLVAMRVATVGVAGVRSSRTPNAVIFTCLSLESSRRRAWSTHLTMPDAVRGHGIGKRSCATSETRVGDRPHFARISPLWALTARRVTSHDLVGARNTQFTISPVWTCRARVASAIDQGVTCLQRI